MATLSLLYRWGPDRDAPRFRWTSPGAVLATLVWVAASIGFSIYTANFGSYNETYGALGAIVVVMLWLYITAYVIILGAELNCELERQTVVDTTSGPAHPLGERGAYAADTLGRSTA
jgi:membrane protein